MNTSNLEDLTLLLIDDGDIPAAWLERWAVSYPVSVQTAASRNQSIHCWQENMQTAFNGIAAQHIAVVAYGAGVSAFLAWLYQADINAQRRLCNIILVSPRADALPDDTEHTLIRARCPCRTALVIGQSKPAYREWAAKQAALWQARLLVSPYPAPLDSVSGGWQWGMKLMQEMLLSP
ncbi:serine hydrolase [Neisseria animalis]|uniref:Serine hydrolase n=1 Tax=Neisseria animalis TaxID=492 RepID=A0A5P3MTR3_NEIAN|nr:serine hydrolase [Neisseria animalis]QEY24954.1 serine hydrolase [Neisseria animalis]ROW32915.1 serine hydrolase [Neisseria animalis]VEE09522.1 Predicted esterase of the alpha/beta hydrolase fold [Neisseria animalis]